ncbi:hypothetical protein KGQ20_26950 [Catenulispora sp. NF23]|uniref:PknH-like extracellular domain-containing protein n=1 Tax=Catenulispora pinistramenti TaxID=2705254 RepID=A0ABS5KM11_9ACTN|nr:hypothetical protein [Catenulispora pinistramenti]MBS2536405.1 hypothetical protein [Catenulispora pinistramenti]MBS2547070.1 hypothetical protein [Catenulispora pinistramenti]
MNVKVPVALAILAVSAVGVSACASSPSKSAASTPAGADTGSTSATSDLAATTSATSATSSSSSSAASSTSSPAGTPATSSSATSHGPVRTDIPAGAMLAQSDLARPTRGIWTSSGLDQNTPGQQVLDPDNCDPILRPQAPDPRYPHNPAWANMRSSMWTGANNAQVSESVITYTSAAAAGQDLATHKSWIANCAARFQWTDQPSRAVITTAALDGVSDAYGIRVVMYPPDQPASVAKVEAYDYMAVILRGNSLTVLNVSDGASDSTKAQDPGSTAFGHDVQAAASKLAATFAQ